MKNTIYIICAVALLVGCADSESRLRDRATELCRYIPDHELLAESQGYLTEDFYTVLDTLFNHLPEHEAMDHEWLYYFVTGNGGTIADYEVTGVEQTDATHAIASIRVRQVWEDGSFDPESDIEDHEMCMEKVRGKWLMSDFDGHKEDCIRHIAINRREQSVRRAISDYLVSEIGEQYLHGELCVPVLIMVDEDFDSTGVRVLGDFWVFWYNRQGSGEGSDEGSGESACEADGYGLEIVSGGSHAGLMTLIAEPDGSYRVTDFDPVLDGSSNLPSARRIFGDRFDIYQSIHSNESVREAVRLEQLGEYLRGL